MSMILAECFSYIYMFGIQSYTWFRMANFDRTSLISP